MKKLYKYLIVIALVCSSFVSKAQNDGIGMTLLPNIPYANYYNEVTEAIERQGVTQPHEIDLPGVFISAGEGVGRRVGEGPEQALSAFFQEFDDGDIFPGQQSGIDRSEIQQGGRCDLPGGGVGPDRLFPFLVGENDFQSLREGLGRH